MEKKVQRGAAVVAFIGGAIGAGLDGSAYWQAMVAGCAWAIAMYIICGGFCSEE